LAGAEDAEQAAADAAADARKTNAPPPRAVATLARALAVTLRSLAFFPVKQALRVAVDAEQKLVAEVAALDTLRGE
jgi:hypothetical protein